MKISAKTDYACKALLELSLNWPNPNPVQIITISANRKIPVKFLTQILLQLKQAGYVESVRGNKGGYRLAKAPSEIQLADILNYFSEDFIQFKNAKGKMSRKSAFDVIWREANETLSNYFKTLSFEEILQRERMISQVTMYTI